jgi:hypothetical protein
MAGTDFELTFRPDVELITTVRRFVEVLCMRVAADKALAARVAIATHELLENALKFSVDGTATVGVHVDPGGGKPIVRVRTRNRASAGHRDTLVTYLDEMEAATDPGDYYHERMIRSSRRPGVSQLGLARVRCEAEMVLSYVVDGDVVTILAQTPGELKAFATDVVEL